MFEPFALSLYKGFNRLSANGRWNFSGDWGFGMPCMAHSPPVTSYELRVTSYELRVTSYELRVTHHNHAPKPLTAKMTRDGASNAGLMLSQARPEML